MNTIHLLDKSTIDKIAAGEVVDRPSSVIKELCENAIDAGATSLSVEIEGGGVRLMRITDNGTGIDAGQVRNAFLRHSTSKINDAQDLSFIKTLGFRGEALSSISSVSKMELFTKTRDALTGIIYRIDGGSERSFEEAGLPDGTTVIVRDLFYNTPARLKFLKTEKTEAGYIADIIEKIALSHPEISVKFINNHSLKLSTTGNGNLKDAIYAVYGKETATKLIRVEGTRGMLSVDGYIGQPSMARGNRNQETYFINGRYIKDRVVESAIEEAYRGWQMKGTFPFTVFDIQIEPELIDVNVHPSKMEIRFYDNQRVFDSVCQILSEKIREFESIPQVSPGKPEESAEKASAKGTVPEPFEEKRTLEFLKNYSAPSAGLKQRVAPVRTDPPERRVTTQTCVREPVNYSAAQESLFTDKFLSEEARIRHRLVGQVFNTYWIVEYDDQMYLIDQHAAHEKVKYEEFMHNLKEGTHYSQKVLPALVLSLNHLQEAALLRCKEPLEKLGFGFEHYGGSDYAVYQLPMDLYGLNNPNSFLLMLDELADIKGSFAPEILLDKVATASCKAAVKGRNRLSDAEADTLIDKLLKLDNPYNCPHGRPTIIAMSRSELERKFKRQI